MTKESISEEFARCKEYGKIHQMLRTEPMDRFERAQCEQLLAFWGQRGAKF